ncbi:hypothetical protein [Halorubrum trapanicum]|uniref:hypothetical protein n=1 Tax=Halorubrum trapanicum TaxID=29284 RepID=UPI0012FD9217|nr:hypothetical protein [Halorubrum trapanicum]
MILRFPSENEVAHYFPDAEDIDEHRRQALESENDAYRYSSDLRSVYQWIVFADYTGEEPVGKIRSAVDATTEFHPELIAILGIAEWEVNRSKYHHGRAAVHLLDLGYKRADRRAWHYVAVFCLQRLIPLQAKLSMNFDLEIQRAVSQLEKLAEEDDIPLGAFGDLVRLLLDNPDNLEENPEYGIQAISACIQATNKLRQDNSFFQERDLLAETIELAEIVDVEDDGLRDRYVETYRLNSKQQGDRSSMLEADELLEGLKDDLAMERLSEEEKNQWKRNLRRAAESAARDLKRDGAKIEYTGGDTQHKWQINRYLSRFEQISEVYDKQAALFWLLTNEQFVPNPDQISDGTPLLEMIGTMGLSYSGHLVEFDPEDADISSQYIIDTQIRIPLLISVFSSLITDRELFEADLYEFINQIPVLDSDNIYYLTTMITAVFEQRHAEAIHLGAPHIESTLYTILREKGEDVDALMEDGTGTRTLGSLLPKTKEYLDGGFGRYLEYMYNEPVGQLLMGNIRNRVAHGLLRPSENDQYRSMCILVDLLRIIARFSKTHFWSQYGIPERVSYGSGGFEFAIKPYRETPDVKDDELVEYITSTQPSVKEIASQFDIPHELAYARVKVLEAVGMVETTSTEDHLRCSGDNA